MLARDGAKPAALEQDESGVWSVTTEPLEPDYYGYTFQVDGVALLDPGNSLLKPNLLNVNSMVHVPGPPSLPNSPPIPRLPVWRAVSSLPHADHSGGCGRCSGFGSTSRRGI